MNTHRKNYVPHNAHSMNAHEKNYVCVKICVDIAHRKNYDVHGGAYHAVQNAGGQHYAYL